MVGVSRRTDEDKWCSLFISLLLERNSFVDSGGSIMEPFFLSNIFLHYYYFNVSFFLLRLQIL